MIAGGAWGFAATDRLTREGVQACAAEAVAIAKASALAKRDNVALAPEQSYVDTWQNPYLKDPFRIPVERQIDLLLAADKEMRRVKGVTVAEGSMAFRNIDQLFVSSTGSVDPSDQNAVRRAESWPPVLPAPKFRSARIRIVSAGSTCCTATS